MKKILGVLVEGMRIPAFLERGAQLIVGGEPWKRRKSTGRQTDSTHTAREFKHNSEEERPRVPGEGQCTSEESMQDNTLPLIPREDGLVVRVLV